MVDRARYQKDYSIQQKQKPGSKFIINITRDNNLAIAEVFDEAIKMQRREDKSNIPYDAMTLWGEVLEELHLNDSAKKDNKIDFTRSDTQKLTMSERLLLLREYNMSIFKLFTIRDLLKIPIDHKYIFENSRLAGSVNLEWWTLFEEIKKVCRVDHAALASHKDYVFLGRFQAIMSPSDDTLGAWRKSTPKIFPAHTDAARRLKLIIHAVLQKGIEMPTITPIGQDELGDL